LVLPYQATVIRLSFKRDMNRRSGTYEEREGLLELRDLLLGE